MQSGDILTDTRGASWVIDAPSGRGLWGQSWHLKGEDGRLAVLKVPYSRAELADAERPEDLAAACAAAAVEVHRALETRTWDFLPELLGSVACSEDRLGIITPRYPSSLKARLAAHAPLPETLDVVVRTMHRLATCTTAGAVHGNLRPSNVLLDDAGRPVLSDPLPKALHAWRGALEGLNPDRRTTLPPEAGRTPLGAWDTWAMSLALFEACHAADATGVRLPVEGLGRADLAIAKDAAAARFKADKVNPRFAGRATTKLGAVLNRALSEQAEPSPPYRFATASELKDRLVEVDELVHPSITAVSRVMLGAAAPKGVFEGDPVAFSINVGTTSGVSGQEDIAVGIQLQDLDVTEGDGRVRVDGARFTVDRYPAGKWRFEFTLPGVAPGRYRARVAFLIKDGGDEPITAEGTLEVRPSPGYVPSPSTEDAPAPIPLPVRREADARRAQPPRPIRPAAEAELARDAAFPNTDAGPATIPPMPYSDRGPATLPPQPMDGGQELRPAAVSIQMPPPSFAAPGAAGGTGTATARAAITLPAPKPLPAPPPIPKGLQVVAGGRVAPMLSVDPHSAPTEASPDGDTTPGPDADVLDSSPVPFDPLLHDYPTPGPGRTSTLPTYDLGETGTSSTRTAWLHALRDQLADQYQADPFTLFVVFGFAVLLVVVVLIVAF